MASRWNILLVEDNPDDVLLMQRAASKAGLAGRLRVFSDGAALIQHLRATDSNSPAAPELLLLDLKLPGLSGFEVLSWIRNEPDWANLRVIMLTSSDLESDRERAFQLGADRFLVKPSSFQELLELAHRLKDYLARAQNCDRLPPSARPEPSSSSSSAGPSEDLTRGQPEVCSGGPTPDLEAQPRMWP